MNRVALSKYFFRNNNYSCSDQKEILRSNHVPYMTNNNDTVYAVEIATAFNFMTTFNFNFKNIPTRRLKDVSDICVPILASIWKEDKKFTK